MRAPAPQPPPPPPSVKVGQAAPDFSLPYMSPKAGGGYENKTMKLSDFKGKTVVLAFFPRARTQGCTIQMHAYRDQYAEQHGKRHDMPGSDEARECKRGKGRRLQHFQYLDRKHEPVQIGAIRP